jgi:hypothetical protein
MMSARPKIKIDDARTTVDRLRADPDPTIQYLIELGEQVYTPEGFELFLSTPQPIFDERTALELLAAGEVERVLSAVAADWDGLGY